ncbi:macro domain-containing protein [Planctellipticum variicoloris]|uniref:macro domain-containing protein n=1 Tax=Planctellipticum variicoloris TaxID=3064265 RepID=UPI003013F3A2|nr:macro domain-containing protein [Planctomycetaceae bacterium SH412]
MQIILSAVDKPLAEAWRQHCGDLADVTIHHGSILELQVDAVVSPANSFGFMDGGIDLVYSHHFGWHVQQRLQGLIRSKHHGELLVGNAEVVDTDDERIPYLIAAPTMRVPMILKDSVHPYLAARAALLSIRHGRFAAGPLVGEAVSDAIQSVAFPGLGTGVGRVGPHTCARQMRAAIEHGVLDQHEFPITWADAQMRHQGLYTDRFRDLQRG